MKFGEIDTACRFLMPFEKLRSSGPTWASFFCKVTIHSSWEEAVPLDTEPPPPAISAWPHSAYHLTSWIWRLRYPFADHHCGCADNSLQQCWTHGKKELLVNSGSVYGPNIWLKGLCVWRKWEKALLWLAAVNACYFTTVFVIISAEVKHTTVDLIVKLCLYRSKDKRKHKLLLSVNRTPCALRLVVLTGICGEGSLKTGQGWGPGSGGGSLALRPWVGYV